MQTELNRQCASRQPLIEREKVRQRTVTYYKLDIDTTYVKAVVVGVPKLQKSHDVRGASGVVQQFELPFFELSFPTAQRLPTDANRGGVGRTLRRVGNADVVSGSPR